ncbi:MAG: putative DNA binding domain-containing protein [Lachnospiraceae bacterium]|nr:putative DNA binding domain-containing protein [Lachnospiraceae bacterium]
MTIEEIKTGEKDNVEYKVDVPSKSEQYMRTVVAFANANGGQLVFGVENNTWDVVGFTKEGVFRKMDAITNAIFDSCEPKITPSISLQDDDRLEVTSPGMLDTELTIEQMKTGLSRIRNRGIAEVFAYMHMIEGWGSGIPDMFMDAKQYGLPEPTLEDRGSDFRVNLYRRALETDLFGVVNPKNIGDNENGGGTDHDTNSTISGTNGTNLEAAADMERLIALIRTNENIT